MNINKKKVLIIPSWYATHANPIVGSFFREQAELVQGEFDIRVLNGRRNFIGIKRFYFNLAFNRPLLSEHFTENERSVAPPPAIDFRFKFVNRFKEETNYRFMVEAYDAQLLQLLNAGWKPDLLHAHATAMGGVVGAYLSKKYSIPLIITEHQVFLLHHYSDFIRKKIKAALEQAQKVLTVSHHQMRSVLMHEINCYPEVIGNYINEELFVAKQYKTFDSFRILTVTYPSFIKDSETFFRAISLVVKKGHHDISVTVIGNNAFNDLNDSNTNEYTAMAEKHGVKDYCRLISFVSRKEIVHYYHEHDIFVSTSIAETFGVSMCEAMATGIPVVATACGGVDDYLTEANGIKVPIRDAEAIADAIIKIKTRSVVFNPQEVRESVVSKYGQNAFRENLISKYQSTLSEPSQLNNLLRG